MRKQPLRPATLAVHAGEPPDPATGALEPPIVLSSAYAFESADDAAAQFERTRDGYIYSRWRNPTVEALERKIAALEGAEDAVALASGMAAVSAVVGSIVRAGDHIVAPTSVYAETARLLRERMPRFGVTTTFVDVSDTDAVRAALRPETKLLYAETPANPTLLISDIPALSELARAHGAALVVDATFGTPYHQRLLSHGADMVLHSATKAICGHGDAVGGVVCGSLSRLAPVRAEGVRTTGGVMSPMVAAMISRGMRTLCLRMERASANAMELARRLEADPRIARVYYPGLASHPHHARASALMERGFGAMIAFEVQSGLEGGKRCYDALSLIARAVSLGDVRSLMTHPASTTSASMPRDARLAAGITDGMMRLSVGIEDLEDLWDDLDRALPR